jgi:DNA-binding response OmpR family regulator
MDILGNRPSHKGRKMNNSRRLAMSKKILVVDDEAHIRMLYSEELAEEGYEVITAEGGLNLLERIEAEKPVLVVLDIKMVDYNGLDLLQDIRNKFYDLPVILCSAYDTFKDDIKSIAADQYVIKSFDLSELKSKISELLSD